MLTYPVGVVEMLGNPPAPHPVLKGAWTFFCSRGEADTLLAGLRSAFTNYDLSLIDDTITGTLYKYISSDAPHIWSIVGTDDKGNQVYEFAASLIDRKVKPLYGVDKGMPFTSNDNLTPNFHDSGYGFTQFFWSK